MLCKRLHELSVICTFICEINSEYAKTNFINFTN